MPSNPGSTGPQIAEQPDHDRVTMASLAKDGTADQTADFEFIGDEDAVKAGLEHQLGSFAVAQKDAEYHEAKQDADADEDPDAVAEAPQPDDYAEAIKEATANVDSIVEARHEGEGEGDVPDAVADLDDDHTA